MVKRLIYTLFSGTQDTPNLKLNTKPDSRDATPMIRLCDSLTTFHFMHGVAGADSDPSSGLKHLE